MGWGEGELYTISIDIDFAYKYQHNLFEPKTYFLSTLVLFLENATKIIVKNKLLFICLGFEISLCQKHLIFFINL